MAAEVVILPGDGIGPEVMQEAARVMMAFGIDFVSQPFGGAAIDSIGRPMIPDTLIAARKAKAVLLGAVGGPQWESHVPRPETALIKLRKELGVYANLRPARAEGIDLVIVRELIGGLYYGARGTREDGVVFDTCEYTEEGVERVIRRAFEVARTRGKRLVSVDKSNVLDTGRLWRAVAMRLGPEYPDVELSHGLVDSVAMQLVMNPAQFDTLVMENTFGDILSDVAAGATGGLGLASSASLSDDGPGIFEPVHGSAPDIAGRGIANPTAMLLSLVMALDYCLDRPAEARRLETAIAHAAETAPTVDQGGTATTTQFGDAVLEALAA